MACRLIQSVALAGDEVLPRTRGEVPDLGKNKSSDEDRKFRGGHVETLIPGCYKGVIMIKGYSLFGYPMSTLRITVDRYASANTKRFSERRMSLVMPEAWHEMRVGEVVWRDVIVTKTRDRYIGPKQGESTMLGQHCWRQWSGRLETEII